MAIKNENGEYIKLYNDGSFEIYKTEEERAKTKNATSYDEIINETKAKIENLVKEIRNYLSENGITEEEIGDKFKDVLPEDIVKKAEKVGILSNELSIYEHECAEKTGSKTKLQLMETMFFDVYDAIPNVKESGIVNLLSRENNLENKYKLAKKECLFGKKNEDC